MPPYDATLTKNLRDAGAIIIAKTTLTELANFVANGMPGNYNAVAGYAMNPYDPRRDPRPATADGRPVLNTGGSSSGAGTAANFWAANVGTETSGSILSPANQNMLAAIKPTVGRISRYGVIPITADQDTAGPMAKSVTDAAILFGALESASPDPNDPATKTCQAPPNRDYTPFLKREGLKGARIGIPRANYYDRITPPGEKEPRGGLNERAGQVDGRGDRGPQEGGRDRRRRRHSERRRSGSEEQLPAVGRRRATRARADPNCSSVLWYGMKRDFNAWLASLGPAAPVKTLAELRAFNTAHANRNAIKYAQANLDNSDAARSREGSREVAGRSRQGHPARRHAWHRRSAEGAEARRAALPRRERRGHRRQARLSDGDRAVRPVRADAAAAGRPGPAPAPYPDGFTLAPAPYGVSFTGMACSEPRLIELAYAFEQATKRRVPPPSAP